MRKDTSTRPIYFILLINVVIWALAWPISKIGLAYMSPIWYTAIRFIIATLVCLIVLGMAGVLKRPKRQDLPIILGIGILQMTLFLTFMNIGLSFVGAGRAAILAYSTPLWVTPLAALFFHESITRIKLFGVFLGVAGIAILFAPASLDWSNHNVVLGNCLLVLSAIVWALAILQSRFGRWHSNPLDVVTWQLLLATVLTTSFALYSEPLSGIQWHSTSLWLTLIYNGVLATAFGYWASVTVFKNLPAVNASLCYLGVPVLGILFSATILGESISPSMAVAILLILAGLVCVALSKNKPHSTKAANDPKAAFNNDPALH
jgi:drug/metabolite transporter (DMT)-like permease